MNSTLLLGLVLCSLAFVVFAFEDPHAQCHHDHVMDKFYEEHPERRVRDEEMRAHIKEAATAHLIAHADSLREKSTLSIVRVPVVWHVLHLGQSDSTYIDASLIEADMAYLNEWFSATNTYYNDGSSYWSNVIATPNDFQIEFVLASQDPDGNPTTGINYRETNVASTCGDFEIFRTNEGGLTAWNTLEYMNVWTCAITHAAGYAYLPGGSTHERDGMVLAYQHVGSSYISGSIIAHEMGHWLGLRHTFQSCAAPGDNIDDTPPSGEPGFNYVSGNAACPGQGGMTDSNFQQCGNIVQIQNCMDYNYEPCKSFFSKGQVAVMRSWLDNPASIRGGLGSSPGLGNPGCSTYDCTGKNCGPDGCGGQCGSCDLNSQLNSCNSAGVCVADPSVPSPSPSVTPTRTRTVPTQNQSLQQFRDFVVSEHNRIRSEVDPPAVTPLTPLSYSTSLESTANSHTNQCVYGFSSASGIGQQLYAVSGLREDDPTLIGQILSEWESRGDYYTLTSSGSSCNHPEGKSCGPYVQMIWDHATYSTTEVACSINECTTGSPFGGAFPDWTIVLCIYAGPGGYTSLLPYVPCDSCSTTCSSTCAEDDCGIVTTECGDIDCGCCDDPCATHSCGSHINACGESVSCGHCDTGSACEVGTGGAHSCVAEPVCDHQAECDSNGDECGFRTYCGVTEECGFCDEGFTCENFSCVEDPCFNCPVNSECNGDNICECLDGFETDEFGNCVALDSGGGSFPDYTNMFVQTLPVSPEGFTVLESNIMLQNSGDHILNWFSSRDVVDAYTTSSEVTVSMDSGEFGFNLRYNQGAGSRVHDSIRWHVTDIGSNPQVKLCLIYYGNAYCGTTYAIDFPTTDATVRVTMGLDASNNILTTFSVNQGLLISYYTNQAYYPELGSISYFVSPSVGHTALLTRSILATSTTMTISLSDCIDDSEWEDIFYQITGADPATTSVAIRDDSDLTSCSAKSMKTGKALVSGFTTVITSGSVKASALASTLVSSSGSASSAILGVGSVAPIPGVAGAAAAGFPTTIGALGGSVVAGPGIAGAAGAGGAAGAAGAGGAVAGAAGAGAAAGGAGAGSSGLSGGSIAGIVVGSVAGAALLLGAASIVVIAAVAAVVVLATDGEDSSPAPSNDNRKSVRKTIRGFFGGVDVMSNDPNGHQSISARSPAM